MREDCVRVCVHCTHARARGDPRGSSRPGQTGISTVSVFTFGLGLRTNGRWGRRGDVVRPSASPAEVSLSRTGLKDASSGPVLSLRLEIKRRR